MTLQSITLMEAYIIENLRKNGVTNEELLQISDEKVSAWKSLGDRFDYTILQKLAKQTGDQFISIVNDGYQVKFLTLNGLINLTQLKLNKQREKDFTVQDDGISELTITENEREELEKILSANWKITKSGDNVSILPAHK